MKPRLNPHPLSSILKLRKARIARAEQRKRSEDPKWEGSLPFADPSECVATRDEVRNSIARGLGFVDWLDAENHGLEK